MHNNTFLITYVGLWCFVAILAYAVLLLYRHHGGMLFANDGRYAPGPEVGASVARDELTPASIDAQMESGVPTLYVFVSPTCSGCLVARDAVNVLVGRTTRPDVMAIVSGDDSEIDGFAGSLAPRVALVRDPDRKLTRAWRIPGVPFGLAIDGAGYIQGRGRITGITGLEALARLALNEDSTKGPSREPKLTTL